MLCLCLPWLCLFSSEDMFKSAMSTLNVDVKKMPLGQLSKSQVQRGYDVLDELETALNSTGGNRAEQLEDLSARFYQVCPVNRGSVSRERRHGKKLACSFVIILVKPKV